MRANLMFSSTTFNLLRSLKTPVSFTCRRSSQLVDGKKIAQSLKDQLALKIQETQKSSTNFLPGLAILQVGDRSDSNVYIRNKLAAAKKVGIRAEHVKLNKDITEEQLLKEISTLCTDPSTHGIIVQLPLDCTGDIDTDKAINSISPDKDVDGLTRDNAGRLARGELEGTIIPCTPRGCLELVRSTGIPVAGKNVVVLGRSKIVGSPAAELFLWNHGTVTVCHSKTQNLAQVARSADILIVAIGRAEMVRGDWIKPGAIVIDCGINVNPSTNKIVGDVAFHEAKETAGHITPVPGGVGPMTIAMLLQNTYDQALRKVGETR